MDMKRSFVVISIKNIVIVLVCDQNYIWLFRFSNEMRFCGEFSQKFLCRLGVLEVTPGQKGGEKVNKKWKHNYY
jgi:hypothetical protein